jgi:hypothetical protein
MSRLFLDLGAQIDSDLGSERLGDDFPIDRAFDRMSTCLGHPIINYPAYHEAYIRRL